MLMSTLLKKLSSAEIEALAVEGAHLPEDQATTLALSS